MFVFFQMTVLENLLSSMKYVLNGMGLLRINLENPKNRVSLNSYMIRAIRVNSHLSSKWLGQRSGFCKIVPSGVFKITASWTWITWCVTLVHSIALYSKVH